MKQIVALYFFGMIYHMLPGSDPPRFLFPPMRKKAMNSLHYKAVRSAVRYFKSFWSKEVL